MRDRLFWILLTLLALQCGTPAFGQEKGFEVRSADVLNVRRIGNREIQALIGRVNMVQPSPRGAVIIWCDSAFRDMETNMVELFGKVRIVRDSVTLTSTQGTYFGAERRAEMTRGVRLVRGRMILTSKYGEYWANDKRSYFRGDVHVVDSTSWTTSDALTYFEDEEKSVAVGNVRVNSSENNITVFGDSLVHYGKRGYTIVPRNPRLLQIDTTAAGIVDTLLVAGTLMEAYQDSMPVFITQGLVEMAQTDFAARCGEATYYLKRDRIVLRHTPIVWNAENQLTGDSIAIITRDRKLDRVLVQGRALAVSMADSAHATRFDQLSARVITLLFDQGKISEIDADRNATSLYYLFDGTEANGANRSSGDRIVMEFRSGKIDRIRIVGGVEGRYFPERMIARRETEYNLDGFRWITDRPRRKGLTIVHDTHE